MTAEGAGEAPRVAIVGGGLAGLAAAVALANTGCRVQVYEARRTLGGRAGSFRDPASGELVDHCQHVGMACCTNLADFGRRVGSDDLFRRDDTLYFIGPDGRTRLLRAVKWLPAPLHLAPGFWGLKYLSPADRFGIARGMWQLMRRPAIDEAQGPTVAEWLAANNQSPAAIDGFWRVILTSALSEELECISLAAARKVIVDGFLASRQAYEVDVPCAPLAAMYDRIARWLSEHGVQVALGEPVRRVCVNNKVCLELSGGGAAHADYAIVAVPWTKVSELIDPHLTATWPWLAGLTKLPSAPITAVHLWFDRPIMELPHAVLVGRLSQWVFHRGSRQPIEGSDGHYYQVVISASHALAGRDRDAVGAQVVDELKGIWPAAAEARLLRTRVVTQHDAVFSPRRGLDALRPAQATAGGRLFLAGDWTATGWPATMESAVRSGYLAAEGVLRALARPERLLVPDLPRGAFARWLIR